MQPQACDQCGAVFTPKQKKRMPRRYCSQTCSARASNLRRVFAYHRTQWRCAVDGLTYPAHPKCGGLTVPHAYGEVRGGGRRSCGILVGAGHLRAPEHLQADGRCQACHTEEERLRAPRRVGLFRTDWGADLPTPWVWPGPPILEGVTSARDVERRNRYARHGKEGGGRSRG